MAKWHVKNSRRELIHFIMPCMECCGDISVYISIPVDKEESIE